MILLLKVREFGGGTRDIPHALSLDSWARCVDATAHIQNIDGHAGASTKKLRETKGPRTVFRRGRTTAAAAVRCFPQAPSTFSVLHIGYRNIEIISIFSEIRHICIERWRDGGPIRSIRFPPHVFSLTEPRFSEPLEVVKDRSDMQAMFELFRRIFVMNACSQGQPSLR